MKLPAKLDSPPLYQFAEKWFWVNCNEVLPENFQKLGRRVMTSTGSSIVGVSLAAATFSARLSWLFRMSFTSLRMAACPVRSDSVCVTSQGVAV